MSKLIALFLFLLIAVIGPVALRYQAAQSQTGTALSSQKITEDDPRWDCRTMGNKVCGPDAEKPVYYCNAPTKKGTPCRRRVKAAGLRCYLHKGK